MSSGDRGASPGEGGHKDVKVTFWPGRWEESPLERGGWSTRQRPIDRAWKGSTQGSAVIRERRP
ncbi:MAG: hypothetical protein O7B35_07705, partial [Deltaproteobacteria bacterium]|nr:hypothetical protein [Deltaproteobacteria bacterium]